jgi:hypothetical protein
VPKDERKFDPANILFGVFVPGCGAIPAMVFALVAISVFLFIARTLVGPEVVWWFDGLMRSMLVPLAACIAILLQVGAWHRERSSFTTPENIFILIIFAVYGSAAFGGLRYLVHRSGAQKSYVIDEAIRPSLKDSAIVDLAERRARAYRDLQLLLAAKAALARNCIARPVVDMNDQWRFAFRGPKSVDRTAWVGASGIAAEPCNIWIIRETSLSGTPRVFSRHGFPSSDFVFYIQVPQAFRTPRVNYRLFVSRGSHQVGTAEDLNVRGQVARYANDLMSATYDAPLVKRHLEKLIVWRTVWQEKMVNELATTQRRIAEKRDDPPIPLRYFIVCTMSEYLEASNDLKAITFRAKLLDIAFHLLRALFALVFLESLASVPRRRVRPTSRFLNRRRERAAEHKAARDLFADD